MKDSIWPTLRPFVFAGVFIFLLIVIAVWYAFNIFPAEKEKRVVFIATNVLSILALAVIITQSIIYFRQWKAMQAQENRMSEQRNEMQKQSEAAVRQANTATAQASMTREQITLFKQQMEQNASIIEQMRIQAAQMAEQRTVMESQLDLMEDSMKQTEELFYNANRAYIGIEGIAVYGVTNGQKGFPDDGKFRVDCTVINKGKTPALNFGHVFRGRFVSANSADWPELPDFDEIGRDRLVPQILPEQVSPIRGDIAGCPVEIAAGIRSGELLFVVSAKFVFSCLGRDETFISHHIWDCNTNTFMERRDWPPQS